MGMMRAVARGWFSYDFDVFDRTGAAAGRVTLTSWRENATLDVGGRRYEGTHTRGDSKFVLSREDGSPVLVAEKPSAWKDRFSFEYAGNRYELRKESAWRRAFVLTRDGIGTVGSLRPEGAFRKGVLAELPNELPPEVGLFVMWLAVLLWRREDSAAASG